MKYLCVASLVACGPGLRAVDPKELAHDRLVDAVGNAVKFEKLLRGYVANGGLWFESSDCVEFNQPGKIEPPQFSRFARCLASLKLTESPREDAFGDVVVLTYEPGFEIEARVVRENDGVRLSWIGFKSRRNDDDNAPTISSATLERCASPAIDRARSVRRSLRRSSSTRRRRATRRTHG